MKETEAARQQTPSSQRAQHLEIKMNYCVESECDLVAVCAEQDMYGVCTQNPVYYSVRCTCLMINVGLQINEINDLRVISLTSHLTLYASRN